MSIDAEWLAELLRQGLLKPSFIPPRPIRELRELTRYRESLVREQTALANRIQQLIESATSKLGQGASDALGVSGKARLRALAAGETAAEKMSHLARRTLERKQPPVAASAGGARDRGSRLGAGPIARPVGPDRSGAHARRGPAQAGGREQS